MTDDLKTVARRPTKQKDGVPSGREGWSWKKIDGDLPEETICSRFLQDSREEKKENGPECVLEPKVMFRREE